MAQKNDKFYDNYFPEYDELNLDMNDLIEGVLKELKDNKPAENNSETVKNLYEATKNVSMEEIKKLEHTLKKLDEKTLLETIETVENWNFKLIIENKRMNKLN
jgi:hypothetical protein